MVRERPDLAHRLPEGVLDLLCGQPRNVACAREALFYRVFRRASYRTYDCVDDRCPPPRGTANQCMTESCGRCQAAQDRLAQWATAIDRADRRTHPCRAAGHAPRLDSKSCLRLAGELCAGIPLGPKDGGIRPAHGALTPWLPTLAMVSREIAENSALFSFLRWLAKAAAATGVTMDQGRRGVPSSSRCPGLWTPRSKCHHRVPGPSGNHPSAPCSSQYRRACPRLVALTTIQHVATKDQFPRRCRNIQYHWDNHFAG